MKRLLAAGLLFLGVAYGTPAVAGDFMYGEETHGVTLKSGDADMNIRVRLQPRIDTGDLITDAAGTSYDNETDLYLRRVRLEVGGHIVGDVKYALVLDADKWEKIGHTDEVSLFNAYVDWKASDYLSVIFGKKKLPYSRVSLTSSSKQLIVERPASTEAAKNVFGSSHGYYQPKLAAHGKLMDGQLAYEVAVADGWENGDAIQAGAPARTVQDSNLMYGVRVEFSPPGWIEKSKKDSHLGEGQHLTVGLSLASQSNIGYTTGGFEEDRTLWGVDVSGHYKNITGQFEFITWEVDSTDTAVNRDIKPRGWYLQGGYYIDGFNVEPVARYEVYDQDSKLSNMKQKVTTLGANWYAKGHSLKAGVNWVHTKYEASASGHLANDDTTNVLQVQGQLYF